jgi:hypothetical protein
VGERYAAARAAYRVRTGARAEARTAAEQADAAFAAAWRRWVSTVTDDRGRAVPREVAAMLGGVLPGSLVELTFREQVVRTGDLLVGLAERPSLAGDPARLAALREAHQELAAATDAVELAALHERAAGHALRDATRAFDRAWGDVVRALRLLVGEQRTLGLAPRFPRHGARAQAQAQAGTTVQAAAPPDAAPPDAERAEPVGAPGAWAVRVDPARAAGSSTPIDASGGAWRAGAASPLAYAGPHRGRRGRPTPAAPEQRSPAAKPAIAGHSGCG